MCGAEGGRGGMTALLKLSFLIKYSNFHFKDTIGG